MRTLMVVGLTAVLIALVAAPASAQQDAEALRRELDQMRKNFETMRQDYQKSMDALAERLRRLETQPQPVTTAPPTAAPATIAQTPPPTTGLSPSTPTA